MSVDSGLVTVPSRVVLEGVPRVHFYEGGTRCPEDITFPSVVRALLEYLGEKDYGCKHTLPQNPSCQTLCTYSYILGVSGAAFFLSWGPGWRMENGEIMYMSDDAAEPFRRAFDAIGYSHEYISKESDPGDEKLFRDRIVASIAKDRRPVIAFGIIGPPESCLVTGYDEGGELLMGWNFFQGNPEFAEGVEFEPSGYFRKRNWFQDLSGLIIVGEKRDGPLLPQTFLEALRFASRVVRTPQIAAYGEDRFNGLAAYTAWAEALQHDAQFATEDVGALQSQHMAHDAQVGFLAEARWYGSRFLIEATEHLHYSAAEHLLRAAACYAAEHDLMWDLWNLAGGLGNAQAYRKFADPSVRRQMAPVILEARERDAEAIAHIERAAERASKGGES